MPISPPGDIVLDVLRASDPQQRRAATQRLSRSGEAAAPSMIIKPTASAPPRQSFDAEMTMTQRANGAMLAGGRSAAASTPAGTAQRQFEAMVLRDFVQHMLPSKAEASFGSGTAGHVWKSWMADAMSQEIAKAGGIGISDMVQPAAVSAPPTASAAAIGDDAMVSGTTDTSSATPAGFMSVLRAVADRLHEMFIDLFGTGDGSVARPDDAVKARAGNDV